MISKRASARKRKENMLGIISIAGAVLFGAGAVYFGYLVHVARMVAAGY